MWGGSVDSTWILEMLKTRVISSELAGAKTFVLTTKDRPQGGVLSPLLWSLDLDGLSTVIKD